MKTMKKIKILTVCLFAICFLFSENLPAQVRVNYSGDNESLLQDQASVIFEDAYKVLAAYPPTPNPGIERKMALDALDALFHDTRLDKGSAFMSFVERVVKKFAADLQQNKPTGRELRIMRFYNFGYVIQTASVTVGIDLVRGGRPDSAYISEELMRPIVDQCDILFITHRHSDHASLSVAKMFCEQGKNVIAPGEFWENMKPQLRVLRGDDMIREDIHLTAKNTSISAWVYPGFQGDLPNNVYMIQLPEGQTVMHTGDQTIYDDLVEKVNSRKIKVDVMLVGCAAPMNIIVNGIMPSIVFTGHENEMGHTIDHREAYWLSTRRMSEVKVPYIITAWGESYTFTPEKYRLQFHADGKFKILQLTDLHMVHGTPEVEKTLTTVKTMLAAEKPDVVVITGDIVWILPDREPWSMLAKVFEEAKTPFAVAFGNHDGEFNSKITRSEIMDILLPLPYFIGEKGPSDIHGVGNYTIPVYGRNNKPAALLYCFDSHSYSKDPNISGNEQINFDQINWYRNQSDKYAAANGGKPLPSLSFFHVPLPEFNNVAERLFPATARRSGMGGTLNTGLFASFLDKKDMMGVFVGHIHGLDFVGIEKSIALGYGRVTGWGAGASLERGARIIELYEGDFAFDTWLRTAKGVEQEFNYPTGFTHADEDTLTYLPAKNVKPTKQGVFYKYYEGRFNSAKTIDTSKKVSEGVMKNFSIIDDPDKNYFAYEFRTLIRIPERGVYNFYVISDDDSQLFIDDQLVVDKPFNPIAKVKGKVALEPGFHELKILYYEDTQGQFLEVGYESKKLRIQKLPDEILFIP